MSTKFKNLQTALGYTFKQIGFLQKALTHRSHSSDHNERLEFLGDSLLNCVIAELLFVHFEKLKEGELSRLRAQLVRQDALQTVAEDIGLGEYLRLGEGELKSGGHRRPSILADALEAILGAIYQDGGFAAVQDVIRRLYAKQLAALDPKHDFKDPKTVLQELLQSKRLPLPQYELVVISGEAHAQEFEVACVVEKLQLRATGRGQSRRAAEQAAASSALEKMKL